MYKLKFIRLSNKFVVCFVCKWFVDPWLIIAWVGVVGVDWSYGGRL